MSWSDAAMVTLVLLGFFALIGVAMHFVGKSDEHRAAFLTECVKQHEPAECVKTWEATK